MGLDFKVELRLGQDEGFGWARVSRWIKIRNGSENKDCFKIEIRVRGVGFVQKLGLV